MIRYLLSRIGFYALAAWASLTLNFLLPRMMPGDPVGAMFARFKGKLDPSAVDALKDAFGFSDAGLWTQYWDYMANILGGDFGISVAYFPTPVSEVIGAGLGWTVLIAGLAVVISFTLGTGLGIVAAWRRGGWLDSIGPPALSFFGAFPYFWLAMLALYIFGFGLDWFPLSHAHSDHLSPQWSWTFISDVAAHAFLPVGSIVLATLGGWMLSMRNTMIGTLGEDYIIMAWARGLSSRRIMLKYAARNAILPNVTGFGMALGFVLGGSLLTEIIFSYPGTGYLLIQAVRNQDYLLMQGLFLIITFAVLLANMMVDIVYLWLDPRTRSGGHS